MSKGAYILLINLPTDCLIKSKASSWQLSRGFYAYVGSAMNNLEKRVERHLRKDKKKHWHIDYLLEKADIFLVLMIPSSHRIEEMLSHHLEKFFKPIKNFGSTDIDTTGNLFFIPSPEQLLNIIQSFIRNFVLSE